MQGPQHVPYQSFPQYQPQPPAAPLAIWSLILSLVSWVVCGPFSAIPGVICGHMANKRIRESGGALGGRGMALAGIIVGYANIALTVIAVAIAVPAFFRYRALAQQMACRANLRSLGQSVLLYSNDYNGSMPPDIDALVAGQYLLVPSPWRADGNPLVCPAAADKTKPSYEMLVVPQRFSRISSPSRVIVFREITAHADGRRHCFYADGHVGVVGDSSPPSDGSQPAGGGPALPGGGWHGGGSGN